MSSKSASSEPGPDRAFAVGAQELWPSHGAGEPADSWWVEGALPLSTV